MVNQSAPATARHAVDRAIDRIRAFGLDGPRPIEDIEALHSLGPEVAEPLRRAVTSAPPGKLAAAVHLVRLLRACEALPAVTAAVFEAPAPLEAKREAVETLQACGVEVPAEAVGRLDAAERFVGKPDAAGLSRILDWPDFWSRPVLEAWLQSSDALSLSLVEEALGRDPRTDLMLLERLGAEGSQEAADVVRAHMARCTERDVVKAGKRALHRLRSSGVDVGGESGAGEAPFTLALEPDLEAEARAHVTGVDGGGTRIVWLLTPSRAGGYRLLEAVLDDTLGLRRAEVLAVTRKDFRAHLGRMSSNPAVLVGQVEPPYAARLLCEAEELTRGAGGEIPEAYQRWRQDQAGTLLEVGRKERAVEPRVYGLVGVDEVRARPELLEDSVELLGQPWFSTWALIGEEVARAAEELHRVESSHLVVSEEQRRLQIDGALAGAAEAFDDEMRALYRRRLESMAALLRESGRREEATQALAAAVAFTEISNLYADHPFARALIQRGVWVTYQRSREQAGERAPESRIIRP